MICQIADLIVMIPAAGGMAPRCQEYLTDQTLEPDIALDADAYRVELWSESNYDAACYMESAWQFYVNLLKYNGMYLHASAVEYGGKAYLFSGPSTVGKSTHTRLWQQTFGEAAQVFNDDKPALRCLDGHWYAYGTPWCGKDGINQNKKVPVAGICFLKQAKENRIRRLSSKEAISAILSQTIFKSLSREGMERLLGHVDKLVRMIPVYELENEPTAEAVRLAYEAMHDAAEG